MYVRVFGDRVDILVLRWNKVNNSSLRNGH